MTKISTQAITAIVLVTSARVSGLWAFPRVHSTAHCLAFCHHTRRRRCSASRRKLLADLREDASSAESSGQCKTGPRRRENLAAVHQQVDLLLNGCTLLCAAHGSFSRKLEICLTCRSRILSMLSMR